MVGCEEGALEGVEEGALEMEGLSEGSALGVALGRSLKSEKKMLSVSESRNNNKHAWDHRIRTNLGDADGERLKLGADEG